MTEAPKRNLLPTCVKPVHYDLTLTPDLDSKSFEGVVRIDFIATDAPSITLNAVDLKFSRVTVACSGTTTEIDAATVKYDANDEKADVPIAGAPLNGKGTLTICFRGIIGDRMQGFYCSTLSKSADTLGVTQFESVDARRAFPCWDEPALKATFRITIVARSDLQVWSNTEAVQFGPTEGREGFTTTVFAVTPIMSTYLVAWLVARMESMERIIDKSRGGTTRVRMLTPRGMIGRASFALDVACKVLPLYERLFGSDYILPKVDLAAIPDFAAGAMENWGLITFRETALLCDETSSAVHRRWVALVVAHELAHQWFGNLVTMEWWKELWLNESFATWIEYWAVDQLFPEWEIMTHFVNDETTRALTLDAMRSSHPIEVELCNAREIDAIFDAISYSKGASLLRMVVDYIGHDAFAQGITNYLEHFRFANACTVQLWEFLGAAAGKDLASMLRAWTGEQGYPILTAKREGCKITLTQHRFLDTGDATPEEDATIWSLPQTTIDSTGAFTKTVVTGRTYDFTIPAEARWVKINHNITAFCRVCYSQDMLEALATALKNNALTSASDRFALISDYHAFARAGVVPLTDALTLMQAYVQEDNGEVWSALLALEVDISGIVQASNEGLRSLWSRFTVELCRPALQRIGYLPRSNDTSSTSQLRASLLSRASACGDAQATDALLSLFDNRAAASIPGDLRGAVYAAVVRVRGREGFDVMKAMALSTDEAMERARTLRALTAAADPTLTCDALAMIIEGSVRSQDSIYILMSAAANPRMAQTYTTFVIRHWQALEARMPGMLFTRVLKSFDQIWEAQHADDLEGWWAAAPEELKGANRRIFEQGLEGLRSNARWASRDGSNVEQFLRQCYPS